MAPTRCFPQIWGKVATCVGYDGGPVLILWSAAQTQRCVRRSVALKRKLKSGHCGRGAETSSGGFVMLIGSLVAKRLNST